MKHLVTLRWFLIALIAFSTNACKLESIQDPIVVTNIDKEFYVNLWEELYPDTRNLRINIQSLKNQDCLNYTIAYDWESTDKKFDLSINHIVPPGDCVPGVAPAHTEISVGDLESKLYNMNIVLDETVINEGQLIVNSEFYTLQMETEEGIIIPEKTLRRVPNNSVWGFVAYQNTADQMIASRLLSDLEGQGESISLREGKYGYFSFLDNKLLVSGAPAAGQVSSFIVNFAGDEKSLEELATNFRDTHTGSVSLKIFTATGSVY